eukprot:TRINITY_DN25927_c0_g2_i1.p1 TRINITY_DN25927_c0_g2~~TRINITY_DN25927_c0_g2_i1.p1  ORF type:complete len:390 (+),score=29.32 TRINITY_DN25927_c0_g2_i1:88-1257(+)
MALWITAVATLLGFVSTLARGAYVPPLCSQEHLKDVRGFMFDLDGTIYGDLRRTDADWAGFIDGAVDMHKYLSSKRIPFLYLSNSAAKGVAGVNTKFRALGLADGTGEGRVWTAANALSQYFVEQVAIGTRILLLDSSSTFDGRTDSCYRQLNHSGVLEGKQLDIRLSLSDREAMEWAALAKRGAPVLVTYCAENDLDAFADGGPEGWTYRELKHTMWLLKNGATLVAHAPDDFNPNVATEFPGVEVWIPGPGPFLRFLREAGAVYDYHRFVIVGKGGQLGSQYMFHPARRLLSQQADIDFFSVEPSHMAMVGDTLNTDVMGGGWYGATTIWFNETGFHHMKDLQYYPDARPTCHVPGVRELLDVLQSMPPRYSKEAPAGSPDFVTLFS